MIAENEISKYRVDFEKRFLEQSARVRDYLVKQVLWVVCRKRRRMKICRRWTRRRRGTYRRFRTTSRLTRDR